MRTFVRRLNMGHILRPKWDVTVSGTLVNGWHCITCVSLYVMKHI